jgi:nucleotide-binding universal stress UspA family protein
VSGVRQVIVGVSGSPGSIPALRYAASIACLRDAPLIAVHAWVPPGGDLADRRHPCAELRRVWEKAARLRLQEALEAAWGGVPAGLAVQPVVLRGQPGLVLTGMACSGDDLLVVGAGRRGRAAGIWHGRVGRYCLAHARCPVYAVPPPALARLAGRGWRSWSFRHRELTVARALPAPDGEKLGRETT